MYAEIFGCVILAKGDLTARLKWVLGRFFESAFGGEVPTYAEAVSRILTPCSCNTHMVSFNDWGSIEATAGAPYTISGAGNAMLPEIAVSFKGIDPKPRSKLYIIIIGRMLALLLICNATNIDRQELMYSYSFLKVGITPKHARSCLNYTMTSYKKVCEQNLRDQLVVGWMRLDMGNEVCKQLITAIPRQNSSYHAPARNLHLYMF